MIRRSSSILRLSLVVQVGLLVFLGCYVLSNSYFFYTSPVLYYGKHVSVLALAMFGAFWWILRGDRPTRGRYVLFAVSIFLLALPYLMRFLLRRQPVEVLVFVQYALFAIAVITIASTMERYGPRAASYTITLIVAAIALVFIAALLLAPEQVYNTYWGRPRLLLGFWHPKQLGTLLAPVALLLATRAVLRIRPTLSWIGYTLVVVVLLFVDSRNMLLFSVITVMAYLCAAYLSYFVLWIGVAAGVGFAVWLVSTYPLLMDVAMSGRLSVWRRGEYSFLGEGTRFDAVTGSSLAKFHIDNYFLEYTVENGVYSVVLLALLVAILSYVLWFTRDPRWRRLKIAATLGFLFSTMFDAGMFSTGNLLNVVFWVYILAGENIFRDRAQSISASAMDSGAASVQPALAT